MKYKVTYERHIEGGNFYSYSSEIIEVKGIVHAHKKGRAHLNDIQKLAEGTVRIDKIMLVEGGPNE